MTQPTADAERFDQMLACADSDADKEPRERPDRAWKLLMAQMDTNTPEYEEALAKDSSVHVNSFKWGWLLAMGAACGIVTDAEHALLLYNLEESK